MIEIYKTLKGLNFNFFLESNIKINIFLGGHAPVMWLEM